MERKSQDLEEAMSRGTFRADLYYRLKVIHIGMPPLRAMREDIAPLAVHFLEQFTRELGKGRLKMTPEAIHYLEKYDWPANVRELAHEIKRLAAIPGELENPVTTALSQLPFRKHHCENTPLTATICGSQEGFYHVHRCP
jgi:DNA-binding NtrC family response regulator